MYTHHCHTSCLNFFLAHLPYVIYWSCPHGALFCFVTTRLPSRFQWNSANALTLRFRVHRCRSVHPKAVLWLPTLLNPKLDKEFLKRFFTLSRIRLPIDIEYWSYQLSVKWVENQWFRLSLCREQKGSDGDVPGGEGNPVEGEQWRGCWCRDEWMLGPGRRRLKTARRVIQESSWSAVDKIDCRPR